MEKTKSFEELEVWKKAHEYVLFVYQETQNFPKCEIYGLVSQFRRASTSVAANIAEGYKRRGKADKLRMFNISQGSIEECRYYQILSRDLNYINLESFNKMVKILCDISRLLNAYCEVIVQSTYHAN
jgi:four helix bundle protein